MLTKTKAVQRFLVKSPSITFNDDPFTDPYVVVSIETERELLQAIPRDANEPKNEYECVITVKLQ
jgi:hypothetical protein